MKKTLTLLTGIVFLVAILVTCGGRNSIQQDPKHVQIHLKALEIDGEMHLVMYDSNNPDDTVIDNLVTEVQRGGSVLWKKDAKSIKKINQIRTQKEKGFTFKRTVGFNEEADSIEIPIPPDADSGLIKYVIIFTDKDDDIWFIDPYLKIPPE